MTCCSISHGRSSITMSTIRNRVVLVVAAVIVVLVQACESDSGRSRPEWSPPRWMHGTWKGSEGPVSATLEASVRELVFIALETGVLLRLDVAQLSQEGVASIQRDHGSLYGNRWFAVVITSYNGDVNAFRCSETGPATMYCEWNPPHRRIIGVPVVRQPAATRL